MNDRQAGITGPFHVGIDVGSSATKCVILDAEGTLIGHAVTASGFDYSEAAEKALTRALCETDGTRDDIVSCVATGYGRQRVALVNPPAGFTGGQAGDAPIRGWCVTEITCHARGAREWYPSVRNIIDVGGQDTKIIRLTDEGKMADYRMNAKCAAGTGTFLESIAMKLGLTLTELDELAMQSTSEAVVNSYCTVFAGTEVIERIKDGQAKEDISMGLFRSIASRVSEMMSARDGDVGVTGGVAAHCRALVRALEEVLETEVWLPPMPQHAGAYGAALIALQSEKTNRQAGTAEGRTTHHAAQG